MTFRGWPVEALEFFEGLEADNSKTYWTANKEVYEQSVKAPMLALLESLAPQFGAPHLFRPYRDVRFSKDKSPYKTAIAASLESGGYIHLSANALGIGSGIYMMAPDQLERYRQAVADDGSGASLEGVIAKLAKRDIEVSGHDALKTAPKGYPKDHPRIDLLRNKDLVSWKQWPAGAWLGTGEARKRVVDFFRECRPLNDWLSEHVGSSSMEPSIR